jgi:hypothetical protein
VLREKKGGLGEKLLVGRVLLVSVLRKVGVFS